MGPAQHSYKPVTHPHAALLFVLLLLPGTTLADWRNADAPHLHLLMQTGCMALMNARTAEQDKITPAAGINTLLAGARMTASGSARGLGYPARAENLPAALRGAGVRVEMPSTRLPNPPNPPPPFVAERGQGGDRFLVVNLGGDPAKADAQIGKWEKAVNRGHSAMMVVSPNPSPVEYRAGDQLTPVIIYGRKVLTGLLWSQSTRQAGLIANTDIAPTIASYFHTKLLVPAFGAPLTAADATGEDVPDLLAREDSLWQAQARDLHALPYIAGLMAALIAGATALAYRGRRGGGAAVLFLAAMPLALLMSASLPIFGSLCLSALGGAFALRRRPREGLAWIAAATALLVVGDALFDAGRITGRSLLGYSPIEGARYYGIGNEAMGALIGAAVVLTGAMARLPRGREWPVALWLVVAFALGWPGAGAKAGGFFVALIALATYVWIWSGRRVTAWSFWLAIAGVMCACGALLAFVGSAVGHTHVGQAVHLARLEGPVALASIANRKAAMDMHLMFHSAWMLTLAASGVGSAILWRKRKGRDGAGGIAVQIGTLAATGCLVLNDAGVVAAAVCCVYLWAYCVAAQTGDYLEMPAAQIKGEPSAAEA